MDRLDWAKLDDKKILAKFSSQAWRELRWGRISEAQLKKAEKKNGIRL